jgi:plastocyanin
MTDRTNPEPRRIAAVLLCAAAVVLLLGCGGKTGSDQKGGSPGAQATRETGTTQEAPAPMDTSSSSPTVPGEVTIDLVARNIQFDKATITVPAGARVTIDFDNQDKGIPHNFALYKTSAAQDVLFDGEIITGVKQIAYTFTAPATPGEYFFRCDVHPTQMTGTFVVK